MRTLKTGRYVAVQIDSYAGDDTFVDCGTNCGAQDHLVCIVRIYDDGSTAVVDAGYRTFDEAFESWPEAQPPA